MKHRQKILFLIFVVFTLLTFVFLELKIADTDEKIDLISSRLPIAVVIHKNKIQGLTTPKSGSTVSSPLHIAGYAPGNWFFEGTLHVAITDSKGTILSQGPALTTSNWMTTNLVPFEVMLPYEATSTSLGYIVVEADNPSGRPNPASFKVPVLLSGTIGESGGLCNVAQNGKTGVCVRKS